MLRSAAWLPRSPWYCTRVCASARQHHLRRLLLHLFGALVYGFTWRKKGNQTKECITRGVGVRPRGRHGSSEIQRPDHSQRSRVRLDLRPHRATASRPVGCLAAYDSTESFHHALLAVNTSRRRPRLTARTVFKVISNFFRIKNIQL